MDFSDPKFNGCDCEIPYCDCCYTRVAPQQEKLDWNKVQHTLATLCDEMRSIDEWENHTQKSHDRITFPKYVAFKLSRQEIIDYIGVLNKCECCTRHTRRDDSPDLPKCAIYIGQYEKPNACYCSCRHNIRRLNKALVIKCLII